MDARYRVRPATRADGATITQLEQQIFSDPWSEAAIAALLKGVVFVTEWRGAVVAYVFARVLGVEAEILNLAVHPAHRRQGLARRLVETAVAGLAALGVQKVALEVRESNDAARSVYRTLGFEEVGGRRGYYRRPVEDAVIMARQIDV